MMKQTQIRFLASIFLFFLGVSFPTPGLRAADTVDTFIQKAEEAAYAFEDKNRLLRIEERLHELETHFPDHPYLFWARARLAFFQKQDLYLQELTLSPEELTKKKLVLAETCHDHTSRCLKKNPKNAECHMMKGVCYAMQASTWGVSFRSLRVCNPMNQHFKKAITLPSTHLHQGVMTTRQLSQVLRAILFRVMPESWWFRFLAGVRGNKKQAYEWMQEAVRGPLLSEPVVMAEYGATAVCYGLQEKQTQAYEEGIQILRRAIMLPTRYGLDEFDKANMARVIESPKEACNYRRERFESLSDEAVSKKVR